MGLLIPMYKMNRRQLKPTRDQGLSSILIRLHRHTLLLFTISRSSSLYAVTTHKISLLPPLMSELINPNWLVTAVCDGFHKTRRETVNTGYKVRVTSANACSQSSRISSRAAHYVNGT